MEITYSIKDLERLSGIKAHTLRIWELRYKLLVPERTESNIRLYSNEDLKYILNISLLNRNGYKISKIAKLDRNDVNELVLHLFEENKETPEQSEALIASMMEMNEERFNNVLNRNIQASGLVRTIENIVFPFLRKTGVMWQAGTVFPAQEHFVSNLIRQKMISSIEEIRVPAHPLPSKFVLFLPEGELHELSLLFYNYILKERGNATIYLGQSVGFQDLERTVRLVKPGALVSVITQPFKDTAVEAYIRRLADAFPDVKIYLSGIQILNRDFDLPPNVQLFLNSISFQKIISLES